MTTGTVKITTALAVAITYGICLEQVADQAVSAGKISNHSAEILLIDAFQLLAFIAKLFKNYEKHTEFLYELNIEKFENMSK
jgi:hypothetical protein